MTIKGIRWDDIVRKFEWIFEKQEILEFVHTQGLGQANEQVVELALDNHEGKLDIKAVKQYVKELGMLERDANTTDVLEKVI